ncbi:MAG: hypothetical protein INQ03_10565 [Candidatus Heimdallarchaeota archaeon]|nr:hypothetical protein [Candidatus Heimdallarchaeota archaeon]
MPSKISEILMGYSESLDLSQKDYEEEISRRIDNFMELYNTWINQLIVTFDFDDSFIVDNIMDELKPIMSENKLPFAAVDGTSWKNDMEPYIVFFSAAYAVRGHIQFQKESKRVKYERWAPEQDTSIVAYVPVPYAMLSEIIDDDEEVGTDVDKIDLRFVHNKLMLLAEIFLLIDLLRSSINRPKFLLWDQSVSYVFQKSIIQGTRTEIDRISLFDKKISGFEVSKQDAWVVFSHPHIPSQQIPSNRITADYWRYVIWRLYDSQSKRLLIQDLLDESRISLESFKN